MIVDLTQNPFCKVICLKVQRVAHLLQLQTELRQDPPLAIVTRLSVCSLDRHPSVLCIVTRLLARMGWWESLLVAVLSVATFLLPSLLCGPQYSGNLDINIDQGMIDVNRNTPSMSQHIYP